MFASMSDFYSRSPLTNLRDILIGKRLTHSLHKLYYISSIVLDHSQFLIQKNVTEKIEFLQPAQIV